MEHQKTTVDKLLKNIVDSQGEKEISKEELETLHKCCVDVFSTKEGIIVAKAMTRICGIYKVDTDLDPLRGAFKKGMIYMYLFFIKGQLPTKTIMEIENKEEK